MLSSDAAGGSEGTVTAAGVWAGGGVGVLGGVAGGVAGGELKGAEETPGVPPPETPGVLILLTPGVLGFVSPGVLTTLGAVALGVPGRHILSDSA